MDGKKKKVVVQKTEDYYNILPIRPSLPNYPISNQSSNLASQNDAHCTTSGTSSKAISCTICKYNAPSSSSHSCDFNSKFESNFKAPSVLKKKSKKKENVTRNISIEMGGTEKGKSVEVKKKTKKRSVSKESSRSVLKSKSGDTELSLLEQYNLKSANSDISYSDSIKEAIALDLLDKKYGNLKDDQQYRGAKRDLNKNELFASGPTTSNANSLGINVLESSPPRVDPEFDLEKCIETIWILDSPDKNYTLFTRHELATLPDKIFESPPKPKVKEENTSPVREVSKETCVLDPNDFFQNNDNDDDVQIVETKSQIKSPVREMEEETKIHDSDIFFNAFEKDNKVQKGSKVEVSQTSEDGLEENKSSEVQDVSKGPEDGSKEVLVEKVEDLKDAKVKEDEISIKNVCNSEQTAKRVSETRNVSTESASFEEIDISGEFRGNIIGDETYRQLITSIVEHGSICDIVKDLKIATDEETAVLDKKAQNVKKPTKENSNNPDKKIWEINLEDINFDDLKDSFPETPAKFSYEDISTEGFPGFPKGSGTEKPSEPLPRSVSQESCDSAETEAFKASVELARKNVKRHGTGAVVNLVKHEVIHVDECEKVMIVSSVSDPNSEEDVVEVSEEKSGSDINELLKFSQESCVVETVVVSEDLVKSEQEDTNDVPLLCNDIGQKESETVKINPTDDISSYDILILKENGELEPLIAEKETLLQEHCYCNQAVDVSVVKQEDSNLEYPGPPSDKNNENTSSEAPVIVNEDLVPVIQTLDQEPLRVPEEEPPILFPEDSEQAGSRCVVKTDFELKDLKDRIMEGNIDKDEILEIIESKNIIQYNIKVDVPKNDPLDEKKSEAKRLGNCLKKQIDVMKKTYEYFEEIVDSASKVLEENVTELHVKNVFDNLHFVKDVVDKTFAYYNTGKNQENKVRYKVVSITRKEDKPSQKETTELGKKETKKQSNKLLLKMLYRMNKLLNYLESNDNATVKRKEKSFVDKLKEMARKDYEKFQKIRKRKVLKPKKKLERYVLDDEASQTLPEESRVLSSIENIRENVLETPKSFKPVITPLSHEVKIIISQIEQLTHENTKHMEREASEEIHRKMLEAKCRKTSRGAVESSKKETIAIKPGSQDEVVLVHVTSPAKNMEKDISTSVPEKLKTVPRELAKKGNTSVKKKEITKKADTEDVSASSVRYPRRSRKQTDFYSAEKYSTKERPKRSIEVDNAKAKPKTDMKGRRNLMYDFDNNTIPVVVLYDQREKHIMNTATTKEYDKTDEPKTKNDETERETKTKRRSRKDPNPTPTRMNLRSSAKKKSAERV